MKISLKNNYDGNKIAAELDWGRVGWAKTELHDSWSEFEFGAGFGNIKRTKQIIS